MLPKITSDNGYLRDDTTGLYIPRTYSNNRGFVLNQSAGAITTDGWNEGVKIPRDEETLVVKWYRKGGGGDDYISQALADGNIANVGVAPVLSGQLSALVQLLITQAGTASIELHGRTATVNRVQDALSRLNDSPLGVTVALQELVYGLLVNNRGAPIATVPITYNMDTWQQFGLEAIPLPNQKDKYYLQVDWAKVQTPVPFIPNIFDLEPTGNTEWPYWYYAAVGEKKRAWVLLHKTHILPLIPGRSNRAGIGTSPVWMTLGYLAESVLVLDERIEKKVNTLSAGLLLLSGIAQTPDQIREMIERTGDEDKADGNYFNKSYTILVSPQTGEVSVARASFREHDGIDFEKRRAYEEDVLALCFKVPLSMVVTRGGVGYGAQAETIADNSAEYGIEALLEQISAFLGSIYPRVMVRIKRPNDRARRLTLQTLDIFAGALQKLPQGTISPLEARAMIEQYIIDIPTVSEDVATKSTDTDDMNDDSIEDDETSEPAEETSAEEMAFAVLNRTGEVTITDEDVENAIAEAAAISEDLAALLTAEGVAR